MIYKAASAFSACSTNLLLSEKRWRECRPIETVFLMAKVSLNHYYWASLLLCKFSSSSIEAGFLLLFRTSNYCQLYQLAPAANSAEAADEKANDWRELTRKLENCDRFCVPSSSVVFAFCRFLSCSPLQPQRSAFAIKCQSRNVTFLR